MKTDILLNLIIGSLQKGGVNGHHRFHSFEGKAGGKGDRMLFRNSDVIEPVRKPYRKIFQTRSALHGSRNGDELSILRGQFTERLSKDLGVGGNRVRPARVGPPFDLSGLEIERRNAMVKGRILFGRAIPFPLLGDHMDEERTPQFINVLEGLDQMIKAVAINRSDIFHA